MYALIKRGVDLTLSLLGILFFSWLFIPCVIILACTGEHEIWYLQRRIGYRKRSFNIIKFATMLKNAPNMGAGSLTVRNDSRVLPFGHFLRKTKLNEIPQLLNVVNGTMSLVGPRPQMEVDFHRFPAEVQERIYDSIPGITGIGSIIFRDEERLLSIPGSDPIAIYVEKIAPYKGAVELWYLEHKSLWVDFKILFLTMWCILNPTTQLPFRWFRNLPPKPQWMTEMETENV